MAGTSSYPGALDNYTEHVNGGVIQADHVNDMQAAVEAIEAELGVNPSGAAATVAARLSALEASGLGGGAAAPTVTVVAGAGASQTLTAPSGAEAIVYDVTLSSPSCALTLVGAQSGKRVVIEVWLRQDSTGSRVVTWPTNIRWSTAAAPVLSALAGRTDVVQLVTTDAGTTWYGSLAGAGFAAQAVPTAPTSPAAAAASGKITVAWTAPTGAVPNVTGYKLYRGTVSGTLTLLTTLGNVTTYDDTTVSGGTTYYYKVSALNAIGDGAQSSEVSATASSVGSLPSTGTAATMWYTAEAITGVSNGTALASWADSSATNAPAVNAISGSRPTFQTAVVNSKPVVRYITGNYLISPTGLAANSQFTLFVVAKVTGGDASKGLFGAIGAGGTGPGQGGLEMRIGSGGNLEILSANVANIVSSSAAVPNLTTQFHVLSGRAAAYSGSARAVDVEVDGTRTASTSTAQITLTNGQQTIGYGYFNGTTLVDRMAGDIAEVIYYPAALSDVDYASVKNYLATKYGITVA